ncbi:hypothetical protein OG204_23265 [Streptomyces sp. NBC_01387]|uniref:hypothetical protein n=1 Tax=unclassified Streptomyces TaxID=2593676 RepID=UPI00225352A0|nr:MULTISPECIES: hypothetical protein [unclassified Streptomyces]MCX4548762.1 hypothetical protein [Streptomyces sp. NBC_01500]WSC20352.1 hypothetical protein OIE60_12010 [Streptomyces sp. NBC_01766]
MQDRRHRATLRTPRHGQDSVLLLRERRPSSTEPDDNPFAPPPEGRPDQPWQPRRPANGGDEGNSGHSGNGGDGSGDDQSPPPGRGSQWSPVQPGRQGGGWGGGPQRPQGGPNEPGNGRGDGPKGPGNGPGGPGAGLRWDPKDPAQRRARYALLAGMWAFFFVLFNLPEVSLLLGSLALYWGISSLRAKPQPVQHDTRGATALTTQPPPAAPTDGRPAAPGAPPAPHVPPAPGPYAGSSKPQITAAVSGLVTAGMALVMVALVFTSHLVYRDYYTCVDDALTKQGQIACNKLLPGSLVPVLGTKE